MTDAFSDGRSDGTTAWDVDIEDVLEPSALFDGDSGQLSLDVRKTFVSLLKKRYISSEHHPTDWRIVIDNQQLLESRFNDIFLQLVVDRDYEVAYKRQAVPDGGGTFPTVLHDTTYSREQTVLLVYLRSVFRSRRASGEESVFVDQSDLIEEIASYRPADTTNFVRDDKSVLTAIDALSKSDILLKTPEPDRYRISPIIEVLLPVGRVQELIQWLAARDGTPTDAWEADELSEAGTT
ncbi:MAG TPA: DUF4194 domain-containing protein [Galbitalea sp.]